MRNRILARRFILLFAVVAIVGKPSVSAAQQLAAASEKNVLPVNSKVKVGKLPNGLTYYIQHNERPKQRAEFYIAQKVGSILEEDRQSGLAHFLEHMCFNGTKNFPGNSMIKELEKRGVKFGANVNAFTAFEKTVYNLSDIPVAREGMVDTALLVLHDWSNFVSLEDKDIDDERGVIREEWRTRNDAGYRTMVKTFQNVFAGTQYANRMPIGDINVINNFPYKDIRDYYKKWYRPDLQGIIIVGDVDVDKVEAKIKQLFADIPTPVNPATRLHFPVPNNIEPIVSITSDPELQGTGIEVFYKREAYPTEQKNSPEYYATSMAQNLIASMFNQRLFELSQKPNPPFSNAGGHMGEFLIAPTKWAWSVSVTPRNNNDGENALRAILVENERMRQFGFTASELDRAKTNTLRFYEKAYNEREKRESGDYVEEYVSLFTDNEPAPGIEWEYDFAKNFLSNVTLDEINQFAKAFVSDTNVVFTVSGPQKDGVVLPTKERILSIWNEVKNSKVEAYAEEKVNKPLLDKKPVAGKVVKTENKPFGYTQWTLSNGVKVLLKKTDFKKDEVVMSSYSPGGISLVKDADMPSALMINDLIELGGVGQLSKVELGKVPTGKVVNVSPYVNELSEGIGGSASPKDFETMMQLSYLYFTQPRMDQDAFNTWKSQAKTFLENAASNPKTSLKDTITKVMTQNSPRKRPFNLETLNKVDYNKAIALYKERFANAGDFTFFITGNVELDSIKPYVETYLGGLPSSKGKEAFKDLKIYPPKGLVKNHFTKKMSTPVSNVIVIYSGEVPAMLQNMVLMNYVQSILDIAYTENIREKEGGTYGVVVRGGINKFPKERFTFQIQFDTDPAKRDKLLGLVYADIKRITTEGPSNENVNKIKEYTLKSHQEALTKNSYWANAISSYVINGMDVNTDYEKIVSSVTPAMVRDFAKKIFSQNNIIEISMSSEK
jgi:zinc protease